MKLFTTRLHGGEDLRQALQEFAKQNNIQAGFIVTCVGALKSMCIRMAGATCDNQTINNFDEDFEIVSLVGTITKDDCHLHIAGSKKDGNVIGGHLRVGSIVNITAEVVIGEDEKSIYDRVFDTDTGFEELTIKNKDR